MRTNLHQARVITTREMQFHNQNNRLNENKVDPHGLTAKPLKKKPLLRFAGSLFAALDVLTGKLSASKLYQKHTNVEFVDFLQQVAEANPEIDLHVHLR